MVLIRCCTSVDAERTNQTRESYSLRSAVRSEDIVPYAGIEKQRPAVSQRSSRDVSEELAVSNSAHGVRKCLFLEHIPWEFLAERLVYQ